MQNIRPQVCQALEGALAGKAAVYQVYPAAEAAPPLTVFQEIQNHPLAQADGQEYLTEILYQIDLYAETTQEADALAPAVEKALTALGLARTLCRDAQADGCRQKTLCYRAVLDPQGRISQ